MTKIKMGSNKSFGIVFCLFFLLVFCYLIFKYQNINYWFLILSIIFLFLGLINSRILTPLNIIWFKFGLFLGKIISPIIMIIIFYFLVTPTGILMRIFKKDLLNLKFNNKKTYWIKKKDTKSSMKKQF